MPTPGEPAETGKLSLFYKRRETKITRAEVVIIFLALIRTITAYYQLKTRPGNILPAGQVEPIITGSLVAVLFCLALTLLSFSGRYRVMHAVFALAITVFRWCYKDLPVHRITQAGPGAKCPRRAAGVAEGAGYGSGWRGQCQGDAAQDEVHVGPGR